MDTPMMERQPAYDGFVNCGICNTPNGFHVQSYETCVNCGSVLFPKPALVRQVADAEPDGMEPEDGMVEMEPEPDELDVPPPPAMGPQAIYIPQIEQDIRFIEQYGLIVFYHRTMDIHVFENPIYLRAQLVYIG